MVGDSGNRDDFNFYENTNEISTSSQQQNTKKNFQKKQQEQKQENKNEENKKGFVNEFKDVVLNDQDKDLFQNKIFKELEAYNKELKDKCDKLEESNEKEIKNSKELTQKVKDLENELNEEKKKNQELEQKNKNLESELEQAKKNVPESDTAIKQQKSEDLGEINNKDDLLKNLLEKDKEIKELKTKLENAIILKEGEELISIVFFYEDKNIHYSIWCKDSETLAIAENKLCEKYPELKEEDDIQYSCKGGKVKKKKTFKENKISNGDVITLKTS